MCTRPLRICLILATVLLFAETPMAETGASGYFSSEAQLLRWGETTRSPNSSVSAHLGTETDKSADAFPDRLTVGTGSKKQTFAIPFTLNAEILWSPDSASLAISGSEDGAGGLYLSDVILLKSSGFELIELAPLIQNAFGQPVVCVPPTPPNVAAIKWLKPSQELLVAAEVYPDSRCDSFGTFRAYVVNVMNRTIVKSLDQIQTKAEFGAALGRDLRSADDKCIRDPRSCYVRFNHPDNPDLYPPK